ncbi:MAG TPA: type IV toxin-antitoxin system AbiEi family antitoxin domain-containing protein [Solirubrobacterales bacterium]
MDAKSDTPDAKAASIAASQHGVVTRRQLEGAGLGSKAITIRVRKGQLHRLHRGIYAVGHRAPTHHSRWMAAVLACGEGAALSHHSAAALWELLRPIKGPVHVSVPTTSGLKKRRGVHLHRCPSLSDPPSSPPSPAIRGGRGRGITRRHNIPVTTIQRTINDLDGTVPPHLLRRAKRQAELKGIRLERSEGRRLRSDLEEDFLALVHHLPPPEANVKLGRYEVDFLWRDRDVVVEVDSWIYHRGSVAFHEDRVRDLELRSRGFTVLRFSEEQVDEEPERVVADAAAALSR